MIPELFSLAVHQHYEGPTSVCLLGDYCSLIVGCSVYCSLTNVYFTDCMTVSGCLMCWKQDHGDNVCKDQ